jgi:hypothetical protein
MMIPRPVKFMAMLVKSGIWYHQRFIFSTVSAILLYKPGTGASHEIVTPLAQTNRAG